MTSTPVHIDLTEIIRNPLRTGIQRVERELIRHWPYFAGLSPCWFDPAHGQLRVLSAEVLDILTASSDDTADFVEEERGRLAGLLDRSAPLPQGAAEIRLLNAELFFDRARADAYLDLARDQAYRLYWVVFDFLPFLEPRFVLSGAPKNCMHYIRALRAIRNVGFISEETRDHYARRIMRREWFGGPVFPLGGDGLALPRQIFDPARRSFVFVGTIEPRKNLVGILTAFRAMWDAGSTADLIIVGRMLESARQEQEMLASMRSNPHLTHLGHVSDRTLREILGRARATIFVSAAEGFGIPPYESLHAGIPVIVTVDIPSMRLIPPSGQVRLPTADPARIAEAVTRMMDDSLAARIWEEAAAIQVPTWSGFAHDVATWVQEG